MPRDIRSYFMTCPTKATVNRKRKANEDEKREGPLQKRGKTVSKKKNVIIDSDDDEPTGNKDKNIEDQKCKTVDVSEIFGGETTRIDNKKKKKEIESNNPSHNLRQKVTPKKELGVGENQTHLKTSPKSPASHASTKIEPIINEEKDAPPKIESVSGTKDLHAHSEKAHLKGHSHSDTSALSDEDRHERKRIAAVLYQKYKNRQSVINPGSKEVPKGTPNCLAGLSFLVTGVLESLDREEANQLIKDLGGKVNSTVGKRLNYLVIGEEAGPKKLATAEELGIPMITEDQLFNLIRERSAQGANNQTEGTKKTEKTPKSGKKKEMSTEKSNSAEKRKMIKHSVEQGSPPKMPKLESTTKEDEGGVVEKESTVSAECPQSWADKYKPTNIKQIIGQQGAASPCVKLLNWLSKWYSNHDGKKKLQRPNPWAKNDDGSFFKAALLSGSPGIGKTTTAHLVAKELGFDIVELNASDTRSKKLLKESISDLLSSKSLFGYFHDNNKSVTKKHVLIMDEVDGMAGNEDRGGIQELIALIKDTSIPIICMCNDRNHQKMRSLVNYCYDLRFNKPRLEQIKGAMMSVCYKEKLKLPPAKLEEIISASNNDIRQTLNHLSILSAEKNLDADSINNKALKKDLKLGPWDVVRKVFSSDEHKKMTLNEKFDLFFYDYSLGPLFVQQNYLQVAPHVPKPQVIEQVALTADSLSLGDVVDKKIRSNSAWSLLPIQAIFSSVLPGEYMAGHFTGQINFPAWLGKNSKAVKRSRLAQEIHDHTRIKSSGSRLSIRLDFAPFLLDAIVRPLLKGVNGVDESLNVIKDYHLLREDIDSLVELVLWPGKKNPMEPVDGKVKAALTRAYNKEVLPYSYSTTTGVKKKKAEVEEDMEILNEEDREVLQASDEEEIDDNLEHDVLIKAKKASSKTAVSTAAGTSTKNSTANKKGGSSTRGRGGKAKK